jgi:hypothetical protein
MTLWMNLFLIVHSIGNISLNFFIWIHSFIHSLIHSKSQHLVIGIFWTLSKSWIHNNHLHGPSIGYEFWNMK